MRFLRWTLLGAFSLAVLCVAAWFFRQGRDAIKLATPEAARRSGKPIPARTVLAKQTTVDEVIGATALTEASQTATIRIGANRLSPSREFKATAMIVKNVHVVEGAFVNAGDLVFELDEESLQQVVQQRESERAAAEAELELIKQSTALNQKVRELELASARANLDFRDEQLKTRKSFMENILQLHEKTAATNLQVLDAKTSFSQAGFDLTEAKHRLQRAEDSAAIGSLHDQFEVQGATAKYHAAVLALEMTQKDVTACKIVSPAAGFIATVNVVPGEVVDTAAELTKVIRLDPIFVRVDFPQERIGELALGQTAEIVLDSFPKETLEGMVTRIPPQANPQLRVLPVIVQLANPQSRIKAGISGFARIRVSKEAVVVPATAVIERGSHAMTFQVVDGRARIRPVKTGVLVSDGWVEIQSGLDAGNEVVVYDTESLRDNDTVDVDWRKWARRD